MTPARLRHELADVGHGCRPAIMPTWMMRPFEREGVDVAVDLVTADHVEHHVDAARHVRAQLAQPVVGRPLEHEVGAEVAAHRRLARRARDRDPGADRLGDLDAGGAHPGGAGVDEGPAPRREAALHHEGVPRGEEDLGDGGAVGDADDAGTAITWRSWTAMRSA